MTIKTRIFGQGNVGVHDLLCRMWNTPRFSTRDGFLSFLQVRETQRVTKGVFVTLSASYQARGRNTDPIC